MSSTAQVILITGCSTGFGREIALAALKSKLRVIATARKPEVLDDLKKEGAATLRLDVDRSEDELKKFAEEAIALYGQVDILINNAGWLQGGAVEEVSHEQTVAQFNTLVFGLLNVTRAFLPHFRSRKSGTIANISSQGTIMNIPGAVIYCAAKAAVDSISHGLSAELSPFSVRVVTIQPGSFRTNVATSSNVRRPSPDRVIDGYDASHKWLEGFKGSAANEPGDTKKAAARIVELVTREGELPKSFALGDDAVPNFRKHAKERGEEVEKWAHLGTDLTIKG